MHRAIISALISGSLIWVLFLAGCQRPTQRVLAPPPPALPAVQPKVQELPAPPPIDTPTQPAPTLPQTNAEVPPAPPAPAPPKQKRPTRGKKETQPPATPGASEASPGDALPETANPTPPPDRPKLGEVLSPQDQRRMNADLDRAMRNAQLSLRSLSGRVLSAQQQAAAAHATSFLRQAAEARNRDLASARSLAQRAEVIARDLASSVK